MTATLQVKKDRPNYYILIRYKDELTGKERQKWITTDISVKGNNKRKAETRLKEVLIEFLREQTDFSKNGLFIDFMREWLENLKPSVEETTHERYVLIFKKYIIPFFEPKRLKVKEITPVHIQQYINFALQKVSANTVHKHLANISRCLNSAVR